MTFLLLIPQIVKLSLSQETVSCVHVIELDFMRPGAFVRYIIVSIRKWIEGQYFYDIILYNFLTSYVCLYHIHNSCSVQEWMHCEYLMVMRVLLQECSQIDSDSYTVFAYIHIVSTQCHKVRTLEDPG